jgi:hypothetical protein
MGMHLKYVVIISIISLSVITYISNQKFKENIQNVSEILGQKEERRFFLPFPKDHKIISENYDVRKTNIVIESAKTNQEIKEFYEEILRSKNYQKEYEYENEGLIEFRYTNEKEDLIIKSSQVDKVSLTEFDFHK